VRTRRTLTIAVVVAALILLVGRFISGLYVDREWYAAMGALSLWRTRMWNLAILRALSGIVATVFVFLNLYAVRHSVVSLVLPRRVANLEIGEEVPSTYLVGAAAVLAAVIGGILALAQNDWLSMALAFRGEGFRERDPYFQQDLGFFVYALPFESGLHVWSLITLLAVATLVVFLYALTPSLRWERGALHVSAYVRRHLSVLGALLLVLLAWSYRIDAFTLLIEGTGTRGVFTAIDHRVNINVNLFLAFITAAAAVLVLWSGWTGQIRVSFSAVTAVLVLSVVLRQLVPPLASRIIEPADARLRERPYLATRAKFTQRAYALDRVVRDDTLAGGAPWFADARAAATAVSAWDAQALERAVERSQALGLVTGDIGWRADSGRLVADLAQQPLGPQGFDPTSPWSISRVLAFTSDPGGRVVVSDRALSDVGPVPAALVYEDAGGYVIVPDAAGHVLAPALDGWWSRLAHAWEQQDLHLLFRDLPADGRMVLHRDVRERVRSLAPFFAQGAQVAPAVHADSLFWVMHLYTTSNFYPLSEPMRLGADEVRYLDHAAIAVVNAASGRVTLVADDELDPVASSWVRMFPELFRTRAALAPELVRAIPPAVDGAIVQATAYARAGGRGEALPAAAHLPLTYGGDTLFTGEGWRHFASPATAGATAWAVPVLDSLNRVRGLVVAEGGGAGRVHWHPFAQPGDRWQAIIDKLQRTPDTATNLRTARGRVQTIPLRSGAAFVQTTYSWRPENAPLVSRVAVLDRPDQDVPAVGRTLADATGVVPAAPPDTTRPTTLADFRARVAQLYVAMHDALARGDWKAFGAAYEELGRLARTR
jgi:uncharacterized protein